MSDSPATQSSSLAREQSERCEALMQRGVRVVDPRHLYIDADVNLDRICAGATLHPNVSLYGASTYIGENADLGREGPVVARQTMLAPGARVASGYVEGAILLDDASLGANAHVRAGTLLEEESSTAHCVGLKQTILLPYVTLGSLINFCDCLMAGGRSRRNHSEVGSGYVHFNYTPWGEQGDKATASLFGDVVAGVLGRSDRIFLGGLGGSVGPLQVGYGSVAAAGHILRRDLAAHTLRSAPPANVERPFRPGEVDSGVHREAQNRKYIGQLVALAAWYRWVRLARARLRSDEIRATIYLGALELLDGAIEERWRQLQKMAHERGRTVDKIPPPMPSSGPFAAEVLARPGSHLQWLASLAEDEVASAQLWLTAQADAICGHSGA
jgi:UDP-N-acetylglucosamine/UDP-N-acetylgalactosamine diphosphorylase